MQSLQVLEVSYCPINSFLKFTGIMKNLSKLKFCGTAIKEVPPSSIKFLTALTLLDLSLNKNLNCLPRNMHKLSSLEKLRHSSYPKESKLKSLPRLPLTVRVIDAMCCYSLKWSLARVKLSSWSQPLSQWCPYDERSILVEFKILFHFLQVISLSLSLSLSLTHTHTHTLLNNNSNNSCVLGTGTPLL